MRHMTTVYSEGVETSFVGEEMYKPVEEVIEDIKADHKKDGHKFIKVETNEV